jgi:hypothetical protein
VKCQAQQTSFSSGQYLRRDIEKIGRSRRTRLEDLDDSTLLHDEETIRAVVRVGDKHWTRKARGHWYEVNGEADSGICKTQQRRQSGAQTKRVSHVGTSFLIVRSV